MWEEREGGEGSSTRFDGVREDDSLPRGPRLSRRRRRVPGGSQRERGPWTRAPVCGGDANGTLVPLLLKVPSGPACDSEQLITEAEGTHSPWIVAAGTHRQLSPWGAGESFQS